MLSRPASILAAVAVVAVLSLAACHSTYSGVYSFKKNSFVPPPKPEPVKPKDPNADALPGSQIGAPVPGALDPGIPGIPGAAPAAVPGLTPAPGGAAPGTIPGL